LRAPTPSPRPSSDPDEPEERAEFRDDPICGTRLTHPSPLEHPQAIRSPPDIADHPDTLSDGGWSQPGSTGGGIGGGAGAVSGAGLTALATRLKFPLELLCAPVASAGRVGHNGGGRRAQVVVGEIQVGKFQVEVGALWGLAKVVERESATTDDVARLPEVASGNPEVDNALSVVVRDWRAQTGALSQVSGALALALGASAVDYLKTDQSVARGYQGR